MESEKKFYCFKACQHGQSLVLQNLFQIFNSTRLMLAWPVSIHIARKSLHERTSGTLPSLSLTSDCLLRMARSLARITHICPFRRIANASSPKAQYPLYYSKQIQRAVGGMCMASGRSLQTTCDRANMHFPQ